MSKKGKQSEEGSATTSLREEILGPQSAHEFGSRKRGIHVMTRLSEDIVEILDALVELAIFKSRSEAVAAYVEKSIMTREEMYNEITLQAKQVGEMRETAKRLAQRAFEEKGK